MYLIISWAILVHFASLQPFWPLSLHLHFSHFNRLCDRIFLFLFVLWWNWLYCLAVAVLYDHPFLVDHNCLISVLTVVTVLGGCCSHSLYAVVTRDACNIYLLHRELLNLLINCVVVKKMGIIIKIIIMTSVSSLTPFAMNSKIAMICPSFFWLFEGLLFLGPVTGVPAVEGEVSFCSVSIIFIILLV
jgi:hypothetical protein